VDRTALGNALGGMGARLGTRTVRIMEVCGTHTTSIFRHGLRALLPSNVRLTSGPGCPVCVSPTSYVDNAVELARRGVTIFTFGDMMRVPGSASSLGAERAAGADVRVVYSPLEALRQAADAPEKQGVFAAVGFETTAPGVARTAQEARRRGVGNLSLLTAHRLIPPAMEALVAQEDVQIDGFLCPGHVSVIIGTWAYEDVCRTAGIPCVVAGFEPEDVLAALVRLLAQILEGRAEVENAYGRCVAADGNPKARAVLDEVFSVEDACWRGLGRIPKSGLALQGDYRELDAAGRFDLPSPDDGGDLPGCRCGDVLRGAIDPPDCGLYGNRCTPRDPVGPCMVSSEGACAAWYKHGGVEV
jgi:hydrogenase expression/formation protein HypD